MRRFSICFLTISVLIFLTISFMKVVKPDVTHQATDIRERGVLTVAMDENLPGYFSFNDEPYGFQHDILNEYAKSLGVKLDIVSKKSIINATKMLNRSDIDMVVTMGTYLDEIERGVLQVEPIFKTNYVVLSSKSTFRKNITEKDLREMVGNRNVVLSHGFTATSGYNFWLDSISNYAVVSYDNTLNLISSLEKGDIDFLVCEQMEAQLGCFLNKEVKQIYSFDEQVASVLLVDGDNYELKNNFDSWLKLFKNSDEYASLESMYFNDGFLNQLSRDGFIARVGGISPFDNIIKQESIKSGHDWRLISAIAYHESRFNPNVTSRREAKGLMQIMPAIARQFNVDPKDIVTPDKNIEVALKLICKIESSLRFSSTTSQYDKLCIVLACYNGGIGHVLDARKLALKYGDDPNTWSAVAKYLTKKSDEAYYNDEAVKSGKFKGGETLSFVNNVMKKYDQYCTIAQK